MADNTEIGTVRQVQTSDGLYDIEAPKLVEENEYKVKKVSVENKGTSTIAEITFTSSDKNSADNEGSVSMNAKGNLAVESLKKHVNIEAAQGIQIKPTTNVIFDSSRRTKAGNGNEVHMEFKYDDYKAANAGTYPGDDEEYAELKVEARNIDLRCYYHGGIALQPCGTDGNNFENKIKFESDRKVSANATANPSTDYAGEGGKGVEFGTFNNEHSSLFTKDYRFNKDGIVYAVTRQTPVTQDGKTDYPTQEDDFKDVINTDLGAKWEYIIKAAQVFEYMAQHHGDPLGSYTTQEFLDAVEEVLEIKNSIPEE